jgi:glycerate dehydrogenase
MKIVVLDGYTLNPGDLNWDALERLGEVIVYDRTAPELVVERCEHADVVLLNKVPFSATIIDQLPRLRYIGLLATGFNVVDIIKAKEKGIVVTNAPGYGTNSVVQMTFALLLELCLHVQHHSSTVMQGKWSASPDFCYWDFPLTELTEKTMGILGPGTIGKQVAVVAKAFGMKVIVSGHRQNNNLQHTPMTSVSFDELLQQSDVLSIHCPLTVKTTGLFNYDNLCKMKKTAFLINTSRGAIIKDADLARALNEKVIAGAGLDVLSAEPPLLSNPLFKSKNCIITPHIAWATKEARTRLMNIVVDNLSAFIRHESVNVVNN